MVVYLVIGFIAGAFASGIFVYLKFKTQLLQKESDLRLLQTQNEQSLQTLALMGDKFELLASRIFDEKSNRFQDQSMKQLATILEPFKERLKDFEKKWKTVIQLKDPSVVP